MKFYMPPNTSLDYLQMRLRMANGDLKQAQHSNDSFFGESRELTEAKRQVKYYENRIKQMQAISCGDTSCTAQVKHKHQNGAIIPVGENRLPASSKPTPTKAKGAKQPIFQASKSASKKTPEPLNEKYKEMKIEGETTEYTIKKGDNMWNIARDILKQNGNEKPSNKEIMELTMKIAGSNQNKVKNPNLIYPGGKLIVPKTLQEKPEVDKEAAKPEATAPKAPQQEVKPQTEKPKAQQLEIPQSKTPDSEAQQPEKGQPKADDKTTAPQAPKQETKPEEAKPNQEAQKPVDATGKPEAQKPAPEDKKDDEPKPMPAPENDSLAEVILTRFSGLFGILGGIFGGIKTAFASAPQKPQTEEE